MITSNIALFERTLLEQKLISKEQLTKLKSTTEYVNKGLFECLLNLKTISTHKLYQTAAEIWSVPFVDLSSTDYPQSDQLEVPDKILSELNAITLTDRQKNHLVAFGTPEKLNQAYQLNFFTQYQFDCVLADINSIRSSRNRQHYLRSKTPNTTLQENELNLHLSKSIQHNASDIHIEMFDGHCRLRIRVDGVLHPLASIGAKQGLKLVSQIKLLANMDIAQSRLPQDGRFSYTIDAKTISLRTNSIPTIHGEKLVLRILEQHGRQFKLNQLGLFAEQYQIIRETLKRPNGLILVAGPTGTGKTVSMYAMLDLLNTAKENISTIEDPAEIHVDGINQVNVNRKAGLDFSVALRALLRQDPDILMIGEIRDAETAEIAVKAAQTGHLVLATVHSRTAASAKTRLLQLGVKKYTLNDALKLIIAQRLPRKLCHLCRRQTQLTESVTQLFRQSNTVLPKYVYQAVGCSSCLQGYKSRTGIFELLQKKCQLKPENTVVGQSVALNLKQAGLKRVAEGDTSVDELIRVL